jgi:nucleotide-binding universal stress UspA family protein
VLPPKLIMSPVDFSGHAEDALNTAADLATRLGSELLLVHVVPAIPELPSPSAIFTERQYEEALHEDATKRLNGLICKLAERGVMARSEIGTANDISGELLRIAEHKAVDLIVIATHGTGTWHRLAFGSVAEKVVRLAPCPVLILRVQSESESAKTARGEATASSH